MFAAGARIPPQDGNWDDSGTRRDFSPQMQFRDEEGQRCHTLGFPGGSRNPGLPARFGNGVPNAAARAERGLLSLVYPYGSYPYGHIAGDMETPSWGISSSWLCFPSSFFP